MDTDALATKPDGLAGRAAKSCIDRLNLLLRGETCRSNSKTDSDARNDRRSLEKAQVIENGQLLRSADHSIPVPSSRVPALLSRLQRGKATSITLQPRVNFSAANSTLPRRQRE